MATLNKYGKHKWRSSITSEGALNATIARNIVIAQATRDEYGPFLRLHLENKNTTITLQVDLNGSALGDNTVGASTHRIFLLPSSAIDILPPEDADKEFYMVALTNTHAADNTAAGDIVWSIANY